MSRDHGIFVIGSGGSDMMCDSSAGESFGCSSGRRYTISQKASQMNPNVPVMMNAHCQPQLMAMKGTASGAAMAPTFDPELKMPVASARSFFGNHSATVLIEAGKFPASPRPRKKRAMPKPKAERASACPIAATDQKMMANEKPLRVPNLSIKPPTTRSPSAYAA